MMRDTVRRIWTRTTTAVRVWWARVRFAASAAVAAWQCSAEDELALEVVEIRLEPLPVDLAAVDAPKPRRRRRRKPPASDTAQRSDT